MATYNIKVENHWTSVVTVNVAGEEKDAFASMKNQMEGMGYHGVQAVAIQRMKESYSGGGYGIVAVEDFHPIQ